MNWLRKVDKRRTPPGAEVRILKALPRITLVGTLLALAYPVLARLLLDSADSMPVQHSDTPKKDGTERK